MVIGDDDIETRGLETADPLLVAAALVGGNDQAGPRIQNPLHHRPGQTVPFRQPVTGDHLQIFPGHSEMADKGLPQHGGRGSPVEIVVAGENHLLAAGDRQRHPRRGLLEGGDSTRMGNGGQGGAADFLPGNRLFHAAGENIGQPGRNPVAEQGPIDYLMARAHPQRQRRQGKVIRGHDKNRFARPPFVAGWERRRRTCGG